MVTQMTVRIRTQKNPNRLQSQSFSLSPFPFFLFILFLPLSPLLSLPARELLFSSFPSDFSAGENKPPLKHFCSSVLFLPGATGLLPSPPLRLTLLCSQVVASKGVAQQAPSRHQLPFPTSLHTSVSTQRTPPPLGPLESTSPFSVSSCYPVPKSVTPFFIFSGRVGLMLRRSLFPLCLACSNF
jgi:hypothetical protein